MEKFKFLRSILAEADDIDETKKLQQTRFVESVKAAKQGSVRYVLRMNPESLAQNYLKAGGGGDFVKLLSDEEISDIVKNPESGSMPDKNEVQLLRAGYSFKQLITSQRPEHKTAILLDIPDSISNELVDAKASVNDAREVLTRMMNHRYYVMSINTELAARIESKVDQCWHDNDKLIDVLDPNIVRNLPSQNQLVFLKNIWFDKTEIRDADERAEAELKQTEIAPENKPFETQEELDDAATKLETLSASGTSEGDQVKRALRNMSAEIKGSDKAQIAIDVKDISLLASRFIATARSKGEIARSARKRLMSFKV